MSNVKRGRRELKINIGEKVLFGRSFGEVYKEKEKLSVCLKNTCFE